MNRVSPYLLAGILLAGSACQEISLATQSPTGLSSATDPGDKEKASAPTTPIQQDPEEREMLRLINDHRARSKLEPLRLHAQLVSSARWLSEDMAARDYLSHTDSLGRDSFQRMDAFGFELDGWRGENIACGNGPAAATFKQWLHSPAHNSGMLDPHYTVIGIARAYGPDSGYGWYWTTDFGSR